MKKISSALLLVIILIFALVGCRKPLQRITPPTGEDSYLQYQHSKTVADARTIQNTVNNITGVEDAVVVIKGDEVYVGINDKNHTSMDQLKKKITEAIEKETEYRKIYITAEEDSVKTLNDIRTEVLRGVEVDQYRQELNNIRDLMVL